MQDKNEKCQNPKKQWDTTGLSDKWCSTSVILLYSLQCQFSSVGFYQLRSYNNSKLLGSDLIIPFGTLKVIHPESEAWVILALGTTAEFESLGSTEGGRQ